jgi:hypothetical protein
LLQIAQDFSVRHVNSLLILSASCADTWTSSA